MKDWESEIRIKNAERVLSLAYQVANSNEFEKAIVEKGFPVEGERVEKSGQEIKEKLQRELSSIRDSKEQCLIKMTSLTKSIDQLPTGSVDRKLIKGFENQISEVPKQYGYGQIYSDQEIFKATEMRDFNLTAADYIRHCVEETKLKTVIDNLPDKKVVQLSKSLADQLGF